MNYELRNIESKEPVAIGSEKYSKIILGINKGTMTEITNVIHPCEKWPSGLLKCN